MQRAGRYGLLRKLALQFMFSYIMWLHFSGPLHILIPLKNFPSLVIIFQNPIQAKCLSDSFLDPTPTHLAITWLFLYLVFALSPMIHQISLVTYFPWRSPYSSHCCWDPCHESWTSFAQVQTGSASLHAFVIYLSLLILGFLWCNAWVTCGYPLSTHTHQLMEVNLYVIILWPLGDKHQRIHSHLFMQWEANS